MGVVALWERTTYLLKPGRPNLNVLRTSAHPGGPNDPQIHRHAHRSRRGLSRRCPRRQRPASPSGKSPMATVCPAGTASAMSRPARRISSSLIARSPRRSPTPRSARSSFMPNPARPTIPRTAFRRGIATRPAARSSAATALTTASSTAPASSSAERDRNPRRCDPCGRARGLRPHAERHQQLLHAADRPRLDYSATGGMIFQTVPPKSSPTSSPPSAISASAAGRPQTSAGDVPLTQKPVAKFS